VTNHFRTSAIQLDRPGDPSVFSEQTRAEAAQVMARYPAGQERSALLPMLHLVQSEQGYVTADGIAFCAEMLDLSKAQVAAVVTFYTMYKRKPTGEYLVSVCTNTLCGMLGGDEIFAALVDKLGVGNSGGTPGSGGVAAGGDTSEDGKITLEHAECLAACDYAPVVTVNYEFFDNQSVSSATALVSQLRSGDRPEPSRGAPLCSFKQIERQIAGFFDEQSFAQDANGSGKPTEVGVQLAVQRGESAPSYAVSHTSDGPIVTEASAPAGRPTSANDAPLKTAESDKAHPAKRAGQKKKGD
jgi:NADH-quinone oxidoreductase subunit E